MQFISSSGFTAWLFCFSASNVVSCSGSYFGPLIHFIHSAILLRSQNLDSWRVEKQVIEWKYFVEMDCVWALGTSGQFVSRQSCFFFSLSMRAIEVSPFNHSIWIDMYLRQCIISSLSWELHHLSICQMEVALLVLESSSMWTTLGIYLSQLSVNNGDFLWEHNADYCMQSWSQNRLCVGSKRIQSYGKAEKIFLRLSAIMPTFCMYSLVWGSLYSLLQFWKMLSTHMCPLFGITECEITGSIFFCFMSLWIGLKSRQMSTCCKPHANWCHNWNGYYFWKSVVHRYRKQWLSSLLWKVLSIVWNVCLFCLI